MRRVHTTNAGGSTQYVQVHGRGLGEALEHAVDLLDVQPHVRLPVPAAQHQVVDLFRAGTGSLQHAALRDALDHLQEERGGKQGTSACMLTTRFVMAEIIKDLMRPWCKFFSKNLTSNY